ncbi:hypothetical protein BCV72DRAFT_197111 [Rhizopus microsporus var. microsporus]|uniref:LuxS/MPP-like metallohydrolase n=1 Tax=Rhizopus microsporus var. microsporus TaxID=86635 RepID=A0A1X0RIF1_RHIZD|nr:hypothetical protein BCV72DRAFT_197111 [Rhizopus microsporus var. microsporus]
MVTAIEWQWQQGDYSVYTRPLEKSANDQREYRLLKLANELQVLLVSDPDADRASASLDVHVGSLSDPEHLQGLAHFCEHLLFMGTKKYPKENDYYSYLSEHSVGHQWLEGALDRFSRFFIDPLFSESCTERELKAVDSEHKKNLQSDCWRISQIEKHLSDPKHPWHLFETGNLETLLERPKKMGLDVREELLKFHDAYYSANIMKLVILGREPLDQLTKWVVEKFSSVKNKHIPVPSFHGHPLTKNELMKQIFIKSVKKSRTLEITFPFPDQTAFYECQPANYLAHLIGHEGPGSILSFLKKKTWATTLNSGHYEDVVVSLFEYIELIKKEGIQQWIFEETKSLAEIEFRFLEQCTPSQYTSFLSQQMQENYPPQWVISGNALLRKYDPDLIKVHLELLRPDNFRLTLVSQEFPDGIECTRIERWYSAEYEVQPLSEALGQRLVNISLNPHFSLPAVNEFIPTELEVVKQEEKTKEPTLIQDEPISRIWYKKDDTFWVPKTNVWICLKNPLTFITPRHAVMLAVFIQCRISRAQLLYCTRSRRNRSGYSHKLSLLLEKVVSKMKDLCIEQRRFKMIKDEITREYENVLLEAPYQHASYYLSFALSNRKWTYNDLITQVRDIQLEELQAFIPLAISTLHIEALVHGSMEKETVLGMFSKIQDVLTPRPLLPSQWAGSRAVALSDGQHFVHTLPVYDNNEVNSAIAYYSQVCRVTEIGLRNRLFLIAQIAEEPCFNQLRTREQLGYIVFSGIKNVHGTLGFRVIIQSEREPVYLENRVLDFLEELKKIIEEMSEADYQAQVDSLIAEKQEKSKNLFEEGYRYWSNIMSGYYEFNESTTDVLELKKITKDSLLSFYNNYIYPASPMARTMSIHLKSQKTPVEEKPSLTAENIYLVLTALNYLDKKNVSEDAFRDWIISYAGDTAQFKTELEFSQFLESKKIATGQVKTILEKIYQGPSGLSQRDHTRLPDKYEVIADLIDFRRRMPLSPAAVPVLNSVYF